MMMTLTLMSAACGPDAHERPKAPPCPPPPTPEHQAVVVGTIGKWHLGESRYAITRLGEVFAAFKPDLILIGARVEAYRADHLEDASFEMTLVSSLAKARAIPVEPIDWFREADLVAPLAPVDDKSVTDDLANRETAVLRMPKVFTFEQANGDELAEKILLAQATSTRLRAGDPLESRRRGWLTHLTADAARRHGKPKRILAFVDILDRPVVDLALRGVGYESSTPVAMLAKSKEALLTGSDVPPDVLSAYKDQLSRAQENIGKAKTDPERKFWEQRTRILSVVVEKKAACCVTQSTFELPAD